MIYIGIGIYLLIGYAVIKNYLVKTYGKDSDLNGLRGYWFLLPFWIVIADAFVPDEKWSSRFNQDNKTE